MPYMVTFTINIPPMLASIYHTWIRHGYVPMLLPGCCSIRGVGPCLMNARFSQEIHCGGHSNFCRRYPGFKSMTVYLDHFTVI